jgi:prefoldin subunit 5
MNIDERIDNLKNNLAQLDAQAKQLDQQLRNVSEQILRTQGALMVLNELQKPQESDDANA